MFAAHPDEADVLGEAVMVVWRGGSAIAATGALLLVSGFIASAVDAQDKGAPAPKAAPPAPTWSWGGWGFGVPPAPKPEPKLEPKAEVKPPSSAEVKPKGEPKVARPRAERTSAPPAATRPSPGPPSSKLNATTSPDTSRTIPLVSADAAADWTLSIAAGAPGSQGLRVASDLARHLSEPEGLRIRPVVTLGEGDSLRELRSQRPVDAAIIHADAVLHRQGDPASPATALTYIAELFHDPIHVVARRGITSIASLDGGRVSTGVPGSGAEATAATVFRLLDLRVRTLAIDHATGCAALIDGSLDAIVHVGIGAPCPPDLMSAGLAALALPAAPLAAHYAPMTVSGVDTVGVAALLVVDTGPSSRARNVERLIDLLTQRFDNLRARSTARDALSLANDVPNWTRHPAVTSLLRGQSRAADAR